MAKKIFLLLVAIALFLPVASFAAEEPALKGAFTRVHGKAFKFDGKTVEVMEFMSFFCGGCYKFESSVPVIKGNFPKKIKWKIVPVNWGDSSPKPAEAFFLAEEAGKGEEMKKALFNAYFVQRRDIGSFEVLESLAAELGLGFDFSRKLRGGEKSAEARKALEMAREYRVEGTPTIVIAGNLMTNPHETGDNLDAFRKNAITIIKSILEK
ncbi:MAG TPA: hypothetical protein DDW94_11150 [Deltaproteobacteria bacterium]|nr:MAG: hypothetical protein A2Z79_11230 [Deltaproteobacteria bacterium GWA2_55_82]OGQ63446.1 MAG: hypothetical protein A3I81_05405 [Deltaproteobacteria bacterium RIFCSPLOWO2_02_FULL_55_12]OIJ74827.1 MAG: hypothetical protein A2V21_311470 [Deltaproteobacteria bacterium GWC2_55_46]HBG47527.1 hypothetical protein [Deltaproteobacteria bacterium]HCY11543.1 hypothetical protein [Deltaproteobacteria bacterium]